MSGFGVVVGNKHGCEPKRAKGPEPRARPAEPVQPRLGLRFRSSAAMAGRGVAAACALYTSAGGACGFVCSLQVGAVAAFSPPTVTGASATGVLRKLGFSTDEEEVGN